MFIITIIGTTATAQTTTNTEESNGQYLVSKAGQNWFLSISGGGNMYFGEFDKHASIGKRISYTGKLSVGKWFTPSVGFRAQFDIAGMRGMINPYSTQFAMNEIALSHAYGTVDADGYYKEKFNYFNSHLDLLVNIFKYKENRCYQLIPYVGVGYAFRFHSNEGGIHEGEFSVNTGIINRFRLSKSVDLDVEIGGMFVNQRFDGVTGGQQLEMALSTTVGLNIKLGKTKTFSRPQKAAECDYSTYEKQLADMKKDHEAKAKKLADDLAAAQNKLAACEKELAEKPKVVEVIRPTVVEEQVIKESFNSVLFETNSSVIKGESKNNLDKAIEILKKYPNMVIALSGHTDSQGSADYNKTLSQRRTDAVKNYMVEKGIRNTIESVGYGEVNPIATNDTAAGRAKNRRTEIEFK